MQIRDVMSHTSGLTYDFLEDGSPVPSAPGSPTGPPSR
jgi:CubicO group peptidase (beta-lactamase class C family)